LRNNIILGGNPFGTGAALESPEAFADNVVDNSGLRLELETRDSVALGEPVITEIKLYTTDLRGKRVHSHLHPNFGFVQIAIQQPGGEVVLYHPPIEHCIEVETTRLDAANPSIYDSAYIGYDKERGHIFNQPGVYKLRGVYYALDGSVVFSEVITLRVRSPLSAADEEVADLFLGEDQGMLLYLLGSDSEFLQRGNQAFDTVLDKYSEHPFAVYARLIKGINASREFKTLTEDYQVKVRKPRLEEAEQAEESDAAGDLMVEEAVTPEHIAAVVSRWTGIPVEKMLESEREKLLAMEQAIGGRVVGQEQAVAAVANAVRRARAGLSDPRRPMGSFMFLGPTGVGKTELTKALAEFLFDDDQAMVRIDMSEFMEKHSVARLIGAPPGYVGYEEGGYLTEIVRRRPYSVILLDEVEKAHPDVFGILLQVLDDGRLTDGHGRTVDFRNCVIVMTSNLGSQTIQELAGESNYAKMRAAVMETVGEHFRPEFVNRIDEVVVFHPLEKEQIRKIADIQLDYLRTRLAEREIGLSVSDAALDLLSESGFDPVYGARPLKRAIQQRIENPLARDMLEGRFAPGDTVQVDAHDLGFQFEKAA
jgi:energy-coupling factor transporter ATP-binding protein EcfA2